MGHTDQTLLFTVRKAKVWFMIAVTITVLLIFTRESESIPYLFSWLPVLGRTLPYTLGGILIFTGFCQAGGKLGQTGLFRPIQQNWVKTLGWIFGFGLLVTLARILMPVVFEPLLEMAGPGNPHSSAREALAGNLPLLLGLLPLMWIVVFFEEWVFRGLLLTTIAEYLGPKKSSWVMAILVTSLVFGLLHSFKGPRAVVSSTLGGLVYGTAYVLLKRNLWPGVVAHCFANSIGFLSLYSGD